MNGPPRAVLDTNVVLPALVFVQGRMAPLRRAWHEARCRPLISTANTTELVRALAYPKFKLSRDEQREMLADYLPFCTVVRMPATPPKTPACRDPYDLPFLQLAVAGKAHCVVSGGRDLLALAGRFSCPIMSPVEFLSSLGSG